MSKTGEYIIKLKDKWMHDRNYYETLLAVREIEITEAEQKATLDR